MSTRPKAFRNLFPFESHFHDQNGLRQHYVDEGRGTPVVMLHGNPTWSFMYRALISDLRDSFRVIAPDHMGCGFSDGRTVSLSLHPRAAYQDLDGLLNAGVAHGVSLSCTIGEGSSAWAGRFVILE
jgi:haloalkane dehalogenase